MNVFVRPRREQSQPRGREPREVLHARMLLAKDEESPVSSYVVDTTKPKQPKYYLSHFNGCCLLYADDAAW